MPEIKKEITIIKETKVDPGETKEREKVMSKTNKIESQKKSKIYKVIIMKTYCY